MHAWMGMHGWVRVGACVRARPRPPRRGPPLATCEPRPGSLSAPPPEGPLTRVRGRDRAQGTDPGSSLPSGLPLIRLVLHRWPGSSIKIATYGPIRPWSTYGSPEELRGACNTAGAGARACACVVGMCVGCMHGVLDMHGGVLCVPQAFRLPARRWRCSGPWPMGEALRVAGAWGNGVDWRRTGGLHNSVGNRCTGILSGVGAGGFRTRVVRPPPRLRTP